MYIDFHKYNYNVVPESKREEYLARDQESYKLVIKKWLEENLSAIVERKWEISEIYYISNVSHFIKLIREAEHLYEFGFYTGCIALVGVASEDFLKYLAITLGKPHYENQTQFIRLKNLKNDNLISQTSYDLLDNIRNVRNNCLHYNNDFKQKNNNALKADALTVLNNLKDTLRSILGDKSEMDGNKFVSVLSGIGAGDDIRNQEEITAKVKNAISHLLKLPIAFSPSTKAQATTSVFKIIEIDESHDEITLQDISAKTLIIVEFPESVRLRFSTLSLTTNDMVIATIISAIDPNGLSAEWNLVDIRKAQQ